VEIYTIGELAKHLSVHPSTIRRRIREGKIAYVRDGRVVRITADQLSDYLDRFEIPTTPRPSRRLVSVRPRTDARIYPL